MTLGEIRSQFTSLLNRRDCSATQADIFLRQGLSRLQRVVRVPSMERAHYIIGEPTNIESFTVPVDLLQIQDVFVDGYPLEKVPFRTLMKMRHSGGNAAGQSSHYARVGASIYLFPAMAATKEMVLTYYGEFGPLADDSASNAATDGLADCMVYGALSFAGDYFKHDSAAEWEAKFKGLVTEVMDQSNQLENSGGSTSVAPAHSDF
jgi:hypothetical protein